MNSYAEIEAKEQEGTRNRTVAATNMNATSSRAHTIVAINFVQKAPNEAGESMTKQATINLVDLAGRSVTVGGDRTGYNFNVFPRWKITEDRISVKLSQ